jgi:hypothetical protein
MSSSGPQLYCSQVFSPYFRLLDAHDSRPGISGRFRTFVLDGYDPIRGDGERMDKEVRILLQMFSIIMLISYVPPGTPCNPESSPDANGEASNKQRMWEIKYVWKRIKVR